MDELKTALLEKIKAGHVTMRPRWQFVLQTALYVVGVLVALLIAAYLLSFVMFMLHRSGLVHAPMLGIHGVMLFVVASPWLLLSLVGVFLFVLYLLVTHFSWSYRRPLVYSMIGTVLCVILVSSVLHSLAVHDRFREMSGRYHIPGAESLYRTADIRPQGVMLGTVVECVVEWCSLNLPTGEQVTVYISAHTKMPRGPAISAGDEILVFGELKGDSVTAIGIRRANDPRLMRIRPEHPMRVREGVQ